jgi:hippurate hydrolase
MFVAQPSEETVTGAKAMLADGLFQKFGKPDYAFALHTGSMPYGTVGYVAGPATSNSDSLDITFHGRGSHGSMPDKGIDPVLMASRFVVDVQGVISREKDPMEFGVVTVGAFNSGSAGNIIPDQARLLGTIRSYKSEVRTSCTKALSARPRPKPPCRALLHPRSSWSRARMPWSMTRHW